jgi:hypothetical protein
LNLLINFYPLCRIGCPKSENYVYIQVILDLFDTLFQDWTTPSSREPKPSLPRVSGAARSPAHLVRMLSVLILRSKPRRRKMHRMTLVRTRRSPRRREPGMWRRLEQRRKSKLKKPLESAASDRTIKL